MDTLKIYNGKKENIFDGFHVQVMSKIKVLIEENSRGVDNILKDHISVDIEEQSMNLTPIFVPVTAYIDSLEEGLLFAKEMSGILNKENSTKKEGRDVLNNQQITATVLPLIRKLTGAYLERPDNIDLAQNTANRFIESKSKIMEKNVSAIMPAQFLMFADMKMNFVNSKMSDNIDFKKLNELQEETKTGAFKGKDLDELLKEAGLELNAYRTLIGAGVSYTGELSLSVNPYAISKSGYINFTDHKSYDELNGADVQSYLKSTTEGIKEALLVGNKTADFCKKDSSEKTVSMLKKIKMTPMALHLLTVWLILANTSNPSSGASAGLSWNDE